MFFGNVSLFAKEVHGAEGVLAEGPASESMFMCSLSTGGGVIVASERGFLAGRAERGVYDCWRQGLLGASALPDRCSCHGKVRFES